MSALRLRMLAGCWCLASAAAAAAAPPDPPRRKVALEPCKMAAFEEMSAQLPPELAGKLHGSGDGLCGSWEVFEDRTRGAGRKIALRLMVLPARAAAPAPDPLVVITGGPGTSAIASGWIPFVFDAVRERRDLVLVDQRGTGGSNPLACTSMIRDDDLQSSLEPLLPLEQVRRCREELEKKADLRFYTTPIAIDDLDEVRAALGYAKINVWGGSYGTRPALEYLRRHPESARTAVVEGMAPVGFKNPLYHAGGGQRAFDLIAERCAVDAACAKAFPDLRGDLAKVLARLDAGPARVEVDAPSGEGKVSVSLSRDLFAEGLRATFYDAEGAAMAPKLVHQAAAGDFALATQMALNWQRSFSEGVNWFTGMFLAVVCTEDVALIHPAEVAPAVAGTFLGGYRVRRQLAACELWPKGELPPGFHEPVRSTLPVLMLSGALDPVTPPVFAEHTARFLPNARHVIAPDQGHSPGDIECAARVVADFLERGTGEGVDVSCLLAQKLPAFAVEEKP